MNITIIHLQFGEKNLKSILKFFFYYRDHYLDRAGLKIIIVENNPQSALLNNNHIYNDPELHIIPGDNTFREFSGWTSGLCYLRDVLKITESNIIFSNDTMLRHRAFDESMKKAFYTGFRDIFSMETPAMIGDIDFLQSEPPSLTFQATKYLSTYLFALNSKAVQKIDTLLSPLNINDYFDRQDNEVSVFNSDINLNSSYVESIEFWLYKKSKQKKWYGHSQLTLLNFNSMRSKAMSIVIEHHLSDALVKKGIIMVDFKKYLHRNFVQKLVFFVAKKIYSIQWRMRKYFKALIS